MRCVRILNIKSCKHDKRHNFLFQFNFNEFEYHKNTLLHKIQIYKTTHFFCSYPKCDEILNFL